MLPILKIKGMLKLKALALATYAAWSQVKITRQKDGIKINNIEIKDETLDKLRDMIPKNASLAPEKDLRLLVKRPDKTLPMFYRPYPEDAGRDVYALKDTWLLPFQTKKVSINLQTAIPEGLYIRLSGRSGLASKGFLVHPGTIDAGYRGIYNVIATNLSILPRKIKKGDRVGQILIHLVVDVSDIVEVEELPPSQRGEKGLGHSKGF